MDLKKKIKAMIQAIANDESTERFHQYLIHENFRRPFQFFTWLGMGYKAMLQDYIKGDVTANFVIMVAYDAWDARRLWEKHKEDFIANEGFVRVNIPKKVFDEAIEIAKQLMEKEDLFGVIKDQLSKYNLPESVIEETAEEFMQKVLTKS